MGGGLGRGCIFGFEEQMIRVAFLWTGFLESQRRSLCATETAAMEGGVSLRVLDVTLCPAISHNLERHTTLSGTAQTRGQQPQEPELQAREAFRYEGEFEEVEASPTHPGNPIFVAAREDCCVALAENGL
jgi:hypothetical protein